MQICISGFGVLESQFHSLLFFDLPFNVFDLVLESQFHSLLFFDLPFNVFDLW
jgi:hypothetical protein